MTPALTWTRRAVTDKERSTTLNVFTSSRTFLRDSDKEGFTVWLLLYENGEFEVYECDHAWNGNKWDRVK